MRQQFVGKWSLNTDTVESRFLLHADYIPEGITVIFLGDLSSTNSDCGTQVVSASACLPVVFFSFHFLFI